MKEIRTATYDEMIHAWLKSERLDVKDLLKAHGKPFDQKLIDSPNLLSHTENEERERLLMGLRDKILDEIPDDAEWTLVEVKKDDVDSIFIIPIYNWFLDTGKTFKLHSAFKEISPNRGYRDASGNHEIDHYNKVGRKLQFWESHSDVERDEKIIMVGITKEGPFTIIDGTHRAIAFERINNGYPLQAFLGISKSMINCRWHIESPQSQEHLNQCHQWFSSDVLW